MEELYSRQPSLSFVAPCSFAHTRIPSAVVLLLLVLTLQVYFMVRFEDGLGASLRAKADIRALYSFAESTLPRSRSTGMFVHSCSKYRLAN